MVNIIQSSQNNELLDQYKNDLAIAELNTDEHAIITAHADIGLTLFRAREYEDGLAHFDFAISQAEKNQDLEMKIQCLGKKSLAFQEINRLHDAYTVVNEILKIAEELNDAGIKCDAITSQGQILLDSGDPNQALEKLDDARKLANEISDKRRLMNVYGVMGNLNIALASLDNAEVYFDKAVQLAEELGDQQARIGYLGNKGSVLVWQGKFSEAIPEFEKVLDFVRRIGDQTVEIQTLRHLSQAHCNLKEDEKAMEYANQGLALCKEISDQTVFSFYETQIQIYSRQGQPQTAQQINQEAAEYARVLNNKSKEFEFLLSQGESHLVAEAHADALIAYERAHLIAQELNRKTDEAYLTGRIGVVLAETGKLDEAINYHLQAVSLARLLLIPNLEGEQLTMLLMAYLEKGEILEARKYGNAALQIYSEAGLQVEIDKVKQLLQKVNNS